MKKLKFLLLITVFTIASTVYSQVSVNVNLGKPPVWAPATAQVVQYYYLPEIDTYYDVPSERFIYLRKGKWHRSAALPAHYRYYNLKQGKTVYLTDYRGNAPYTLYKTHKVKYGKMNHKKMNHKKMNHKKSVVYKGKNHKNNKNNKNKK